MLTIRQAESSGDIDTVRELFREYQAFAFRDIPQYCDNPIAGARYLGRSLSQ